MKEIIQKIKELLKKFFGINKTKYLGTANNNAEIKPEKPQEKNINNFIKDIQLEDAETSRIKNIQQKFKNGEIKLQDLSNEDKTKLKSLYIKQITDQIKEISEYQNKLINIADSAN